ncbi:hypothetical protein BO78DRAFT_452663 [Aspergillus sclerotiicarbonarius CBS 121057]|uniref:Uncharacterized protein n=1 Tax=Aspergillus sclerotiicarbonarius (strain CBS 121057 / IBT 28362) TaxID=1448318 RepID=A0A319DZ30_ASPSB|nr:hypothetical protein BO78DRAFT_452663 [Aspergillus sclerotiicarbonarius CBS 121057]
MRLQQEMETLTALFLAGLLYTPQVHAAAVSLVPMTLTSHSYPDTTSTSALSSQNDPSSSVSIPLSHHPSSVTVTANTATATRTSSSIKTSSTILCVAYQDPDSGSDDTVCTCSGSDKSYPTLSGTNICGYTAIPTPTPTGLCVAHQEPDSGTDGTVCVCNGSDESFPTLSSGSDICGYTTIPSTTTNTATTATITNPYPYTAKDPYDNIIACATESSLDIDGTQIPYCAGSKTTISYAPTPATYTWGMWSLYSYDKTCVGAHCVGTPDGLGFYAMTSNRKKVCDVKDKDFARNAQTGKVIDGYVDDIYFKDGICGAGIPYWCNRTSSDSEMWNCADAQDNHRGYCQYIEQSLATEISEVCEAHGGDDAWYEKMNCTGPWECT